MQDGKPVRVKYLVPVTFRLDGNDKAISFSEDTEYYVDDKQVDANILLRQVFLQKTQLKKQKKSSLLIMKIALFLKKPGQKNKVFMFTKK